MTGIAWETSHSVDANVTAEFAWNYWTNVANWDDPPAEFELDGRFEAGASGRTRMPGREPLGWIIREVGPGRTATIEMALDRATLSFEWRFDEIEGGRTRLTQRIVLGGENAGAYVEQVRPAFGSNLPGGMSRIARAMEQAEAHRTQGS